jgi:hypothetical protein
MIAVSFVIFANASATACVFPPPQGWVPLQRGAAESDADWEARQTADLQARVAAQDEQMREADSVYQARLWERSAAIALAEVTPRKSKVDALSIYARPLVWLKGKPHWAFGTGLSAQLELNPAWSCELDVPFALLLGAKPGDKIVLFFDLGFVTPADVRDALPQDSVTQSRLRAILDDLN